MKVIITDCDHENIDIETKIFADAGIDMELKQAVPECRDIYSSVCKNNRKGYGTLS